MIGFECPEAAVSQGSVYVTFNVRNITVQYTEPTFCLEGVRFYLFLPGLGSHVLQHHPDIQVLIRKLRSGIDTLLLLRMV